MLRVFLNELIPKIRLKQKNERSMKGHFPNLKPPYFLVSLVIISLQGFSQGIILSEIGDSSSYNETTFGGIIEIRNAGKSTIDVTGYSVEDPSTGYDPDGSRTYLSYDTVGCGDDMILEPNEVLSIFRFLNKNSQTINLYNAANVLISSVTWGDSPHFRAASASGLWTNGPTPVVPDGRSIVNIGTGTSWLDWVASDERTPCVSKNNTGQSSRKNINEYMASDAIISRSKIQHLSEDKSSVLIKKEEGYIEWEVTMETSGIFDAFINYSSLEEGISTSKGILSVNDKSYSKLEFEHHRLPTEIKESQEEGSFPLNAFTKVYLKEGVNTVRLTGKENFNKKELLINYFGIVANAAKTKQQLVKAQELLANIPTGYSQVQAHDASDEWISKFSLGGIEHNSGSSVYSDFSALSTELVPGKIYQYTINPAWSGTIFNEGYAIWIDYNRDGTLSEEEQVVAIAPSRMETISGSFTIPRDAQQGSTKIRVAIKYNDIPGLASESFANGEYEDYVGVIAPMPIEQMAIAKIKEAVSIFPNPVIGGVLNIDSTVPVDVLELFSMQGQLVLKANGTKTMNLESLNKGNYILKVHDADGNLHTKQVSFEK